jgi:ABC-type methionine transport system permease subunit
MPFSISLFLIVDFLLSINSRRGMAPHLVSHYVTTYYLAYMRTLPFYILILPSHLLT